MSNDKNNRVPFKLSDSFNWPVKFPYAIDGEFIDSEITCVFKRLTLTEFATATAKIQELELTGLTAVNEIRNFLCAVTNDIEGVEFDGDITNQAERVARITDDMAIASAMYSAYNSAIVGRELQVGNLETPPN